MALQMAFKAVNDTAGPDSLVPTLLVYGAFPRINNTSPPLPSTTHRATAIKKAMDEIRKLRAKRQINDALATQNRPSTKAIHNLPLNSPVLVWRKGNGNQSGSWDGPYKLVSASGELCVLALPNGYKTFRSTSIKPYLVDDLVSLDTGFNALPESTATAAVLPAPPTDISIPLPQPPKRSYGRPRKYPIDRGSRDISVFIQQQDLNRH
jgi:hypothetical protein